MNFDPLQPDNRFWVHTLCKVVSSKTQNWDVTFAPSPL
jgi:hypothetical protein